jgi:hypothetical protein
MMADKKTITFDLDELAKLLDEESGTDYTGGPVCFGKWEVDREGNLVEIGYDDHEPGTGKPVEKTRKVLMKGKLSGGHDAKDRAIWMINRIDKQLSVVMDAKSKLHDAEEGLRDVSTELRGEMRAWNWCCTNPDIEITIDLMKIAKDGIVINHGVYNNYKCKSCGKTWVEMVSPGPGYASISSIEKKEIEDYHKRYIKKPKIRCPVCHNAGIHVVTVNEDKKTHHYEIKCLNCGWKSDPMEHAWGRLDKTTATGS